MDLHMIPTVILHVCQSATLMAKRASFSSRAILFAVLLRDVGHTRLGTHVSILTTGQLHVLELFDVEQSRPRCVTLHGRSQQIGLSGHTDQHDVHFPMLW
jgi:hypothetical protein